MRFLRRLAWIVIPAVLFGVLSACAQPPDNRTLVTATRVVVYAPAIPAAAKVESGSCWTESIAVNRAGAWRCTSGNMISDPCFERAGASGEVICGADPAGGKDGFILKLDKPLPKPAVYPPGVNPAPWMFVLADGSTCSAHTGTLAFIGDAAVRYGCSDSSGCKDGECPRLTGVLEDLRTGRIWTAQKVVFASSRDPKRPFKLVERKAVPILTVWK